MLWSILKILIFLAIAAGLAFAAAWVLETPGAVKIAFGSREVFLSPLGFVIALVALVVMALILVKLLALLGAVVRFLLGDETAISRHFSRSRERRGFDALADGMVAVASGDPKTASKKAQKADKLSEPARSDATADRAGRRTERGQEQGLRGLQGDAPE